MYHYCIYTVYTALRLAPSDGVQASGFADRGVVGRGVVGGGVGAAREAAGVRLGGRQTGGSSTWAGQRGPGRSAGGGALLAGGELFTDPGSGGGELGGLACHVEGCWANLEVAVPFEHRPE